jgi:hypothetical protein
MVTVMSIPNLVPLVDGYDPLLTFVIPRQVATVCFQRLHFVGSKAMFSENLELVSQSAAFDHNLAQDMKHEVPSKLITNQLSRTTILLLCISFLVMFMFMLCFLFPYLVC